MCQLKNVVLHIWYYSKCIQHERHIISKSSDLETKQSLYKSTSTCGIYFLILYRGATGAPQMPKAVKTPGTAARRCWHRFLFFKIKVRPQSCQSYPIWCPCFSDAQILGGIVKGQLISKWPFGVIVLTKIQTKFILGISALA